MIPAGSTKTDHFIWMRWIKAFPKDVTSLKFHILDCGCVYYQRLSRDGDLDAQIGIYRDAENGPCEVCMVQEETWEDRVIDQNVVYNTRFQIESIWSYRFFVKIFNFLTGKRIESGTGKKNARKVMISSL